MTAPFADAGGLGASLAIAFAIGVAFGWALERAGLGSARKLVGQFYLTDLTVFKVMFSAIVTAMLGAFWLSRLGVLDLSRVYVPETFIWPQLAGGLIFGAGFALAGLCPGTSCVAAATGRGDGVAVAAGMFSGILATGFAFNALQTFYTSGARGTFTLPQFFRAPDGIVVALVIAIALAAFWLSERFLGERPGLNPVRSRNRIALAAPAIALAILAAVMTPRHVMARAVLVREVGAVDLAEWIKDRRPGLQIVDVRSAAAFDEYHVPAAVRIPIDALGNLHPPAGTTIVVYGNDAADSRRAADVLKTAGDADVHVLRRGTAGWLDEVMNPALPDGASVEAKAAFVRVSAISRYFGGVPRIGRPAGSATVQQVRRRGC